MDYKKAAQELFEILVLATVVCKNTDIFNFLCKRYPELINDYVKKIEEEIKDIEPPELTEEEDIRMWNELWNKIKEWEG